MQRPSQASNINDPGTKKSSNIYKGKHLKYVLGSALQDGNDGHALVVGNIEHVNDSAARGQAHVDKQGRVFKFLSNKEINEEKYQ